MVASPLYVSAPCALVLGACSGHLFKQSHGGDPYPANVWLRLCMGKALSSFQAPSSVRWGSELDDFQILCQ